MTDERFWEIIDAAYHENLYYPEKKQRTYSGKIETNEVVIKCPCRRVLNLKGMGLMKDGRWTSFDNKNIYFFYADGEIHIKDEKRLLSHYEVTIIYDNGEE